MVQGKNERGSRRERSCRRWATGMHVVLAVVLAALAVVLVNVLAWRLPHSWELDVRSRYNLSEKTRTMLAGLQGQVEVIVILDPDNRLFDDVRILLREYQHVAHAIGGLGLALEWVNPNRDIARTRQLARTYELEKENQVIFRSGENFRILNIGELARYEYEITDSGIARRLVGFLGEQAFSSAILAVVSQTAPVVYFLTGHGERDIDDFSPVDGYSSLARAISRDHFDVRRFLAAGQKGIPADCDILVIAGPRQRLADEELRWIDAYLTQRRGRVLLLLDAGVDAGLDALLDRWQITAGEGYVTGLQIPGWGLVVQRYGEHPVTRPLRNVTSAFVAPRPLHIPVQEDGVAGLATAAPEDRIRVTGLAGAGPEGWIETDAEQHPPVYDEGQDRRGPVQIAVAAELGPMSPDAQLSPIRLVVIGDSHFVANAALGSGMGGNLSFFMSALNWLADRDTLLAIEPNVPFVLQPGLTSAQWRRLSLVVIFGLPGLVGLLGAWVGFRRKR